jgi:hypothetical protein
MGTDSKENSLLEKPVSSPIVIRGIRGSASVA